MLKFSCVILLTVLAANILGRRVPADTFKLNHFISIGSIYSVRVRVTFSLRALRSRSPRRKRKMSSRKTSS